MRLGPFLVSDARKPQAQVAGNVKETPLTPSMSMASISSTCLQYLVCWISTVLILHGALRHASSVSARRAARAVARNISPHESISHNPAASPLMRRASTAPSRSHRKHRRRVSFRDKHRMSWRNTSSALTDTKGQRTDSISVFCITTSVHGKGPTCWSDVRGGCFASWNRAYTLKAWRFLAIRARC